jgi:hypothetical protein
MKTCSKCTTQKDEFKRDRTLEELLEWVALFLENGASTLTTFHNQLQSNRVSG